MPTKPKKLVDKKWLFAKMLADTQQTQFSLFKSFDKPYTDYDNFLTKLILFVKNNKFIIMRTRFSDLNVFVKNKIENELTLTNKTLCQYILTNCHKGLAYKHYTFLDTDKLAAIPDYLSCIETDDLVDIQQYIINTSNRYNGILRVYNNFIDSNESILKEQTRLAKLTYYIKYDV